MSTQTTLIDCRGMRCPAPILALSKATRGAARPARLEVLADDQDFPVDVEAWCRSTGATLAGLDRNVDGFVARIDLGAPLGEVASASLVSGSAQALGASSLLALDCRGMRCPAPILAVARAAKAALGPTVLEVRADDGDFRTDLEAWSRSTGNPVLSIAAEGSATVARVGLRGAVDADAPDVAPAPMTGAQPRVLEPSSGEQPVADLDLRDATAGVALLSIGQRALEGGEFTFVTTSSSALERQLQAWSAAVGLWVELEVLGDALIGRVRAQAAEAPAQRLTAEPARAVAPASLADAAVAVPRENRMTLLVIHNDFEALMAALMVANASAAQGMKVEVYFSFWGINVLRGDQRRSVAGTELERPSVLKRMMKWMMPAGPDRQGMGKMNYGGAGVGMMKHFMRQQNILSLRELMQQAIDMEVKFVVCTMSMGIMGVSKADLMDLPNLEFGGVTAFSSAARVSASSLVF